MLPLDRLAHVVVHAGLEAALAVALHGARGHRDDRHVRAGRRLDLADRARRVIAAEHRHLRRPSESDRTSGGGTRRSPAWPFGATVTTCPSRDSSDTATFWLTTLSSASRMRSGARRSPAVTSTLAVTKRGAAREHLHQSGSAVPSA